MDKKYLPVILLVIGIVAAGGVYLSMKGASAPLPTATPIVEEVAPEVPFDQRPFVSLTPRSDGHWLKLTISGVNKVTSSTKVEYILEYKTSDDVTQGVPGTVALNGITTIDRDLLLGSESSGKFRYDQGVHEGTLTLRFRDSAGKLLGKLTSNFKLMDNTEKALTSVDSNFTYTLDKLPKKGYFVVMPTIGVIEGVKGDIAQGPYGVFGSESIAFPGKVTLEGTTVSKYSEGKWNDLKNGVSSDLGVFVSTK